MKKGLYVVLMFVLLCATGAHPAPTQSKGVDFLARFGYIDYNPRLGNIMSQHDLSAAVMNFQRFAGLEQTGQLDHTTLEKMDSPRCGNRDVVGSDAAARKKRYALQGSKWQKKHLTYKIASHTTDISRRDTENAINKAFKVWEAESGLTFRQVRSSKADIEIKFAEKAHGDGDPFDGPSKTLAHAFFPQFGGDAHFDEAEKWAVSADKGVSLFIVAAHEFGHSLGLSHSDVNQALMAPFYNPNYDGLHDDDIRAIRILYGSPSDKHRPQSSTTPPRTTRKPRPGITRQTTTTKTPPVGACNGRFDAITMVRNGTTFAFKGDKFWKLNDQGMEPGYPKSTKKIWGLSGKVDASLSFGAYTDLFQGDVIHRYINGIPMHGYPKRISEVYKGIPSNLDTAFVWSGNGKVYFVKGDKYWRYNPSLRKSDNGYPRPLSVWKGLPERLDAALKWKDRTYFFKNGYYWRFDDERVEVAQSLKTPYPRRSDAWWLGCTDNTLKSSPEETGIGDKNEDVNDGDGNGASSRFNTVPRAMLSTLLMFIVSMLLC
ncbi:matrix metalloproteinase-14-like [Styela clava]